MTGNEMSVAVRILSTILAVGSVVGSLSAQQESAREGTQPTIDFARDIQPIFAKRCYKCHGPNEAEGGLKLDSRDGAFGELDSGMPAIVPGDLTQGELLARITGTGDGDRMPPEGKPLSDEEVAAIKVWIQQGAEWASHWAFQAPARPAVPEVSSPDWVSNPIDAFVLHRLDSAGLKPAAAADRIALLRRAHYDLTGLPPGLADVQKFLADESPQAWERVIDNLLASPQYGEKWATHWLDVVRYAETNGYERDGRKELIWKYRDYVIRSLNDDKPYDQFVREQLAGDELPGENPDQTIATGFYRLGIWDDEPADRELARYDYLDDLVRVTGESFLGLTIGCARCHDHKIDPISQKDYYAMLDFFSNVSPHGSGKANHIQVTSEDTKAAYEQQVQEKRQREQKFQAQIRQLEQRLFAAIRKTDPDFQAPETGQSPESGNVLPDSRKTPQLWRITERKPADNWLDIAFDDSKWKEAKGGFGTEGTPGIHLGTRWGSRDIWMRRYFGLDEIPTKVMLQIHHDEDAEIYINGTLVAEFRGYIREYTEVDISQNAVNVLQTGRNTIAIHCRNTGGGQYIDAGLVVDGADTVRRLFAEQGDKLLGENTNRDYVELRRQLAESQANVPALPVEFAMAVAERGQNKTWILGRGLPSMKGDEVQAAFPEILNPPEPVYDEVAPENSSGRRTALARWITSPDNPMTSRVVVNRLWQHHFGRGIVRSSSDFGYQGTPPTHPQLLDWLSAELISRGWSLKQMHKLIMLSSTYQMSSTGNQQALDVDPNNDLFWRFNLRRLTAEEIRDSVLAVSGTLNLRMYGPPIFPPLSPEVLATASRPGAAWGQSSPEDSARRTVYVHVKRSLRPPMLSGFDAPETDTACAVRLTTTVPTQALAMLNSDFLNQQAQILADRITAEFPDSVEQRLRFAVQLTTGRSADDGVIQEDLKFLKQLEQERQVTAEQALQIFCLLQLNTNEFVYLD